ncbi:hypothetical protein P7C71_g4019, partial [Lecanoromycetidae sp. Uapishka_2]
MASESHMWKQQGDNYLNEGQFLKAVHCYDKALQLVKVPSEACVLLLHRSHARLQLCAFDAAHADTKAALKLPPACNTLGSESEKGWFQAAQAMYGLRRFKDSNQYLMILRSRYEKQGTTIETPRCQVELPGRSEVVAKGLRCQTRLKEQEGSIDFANMLREAEETYPNPYLDRADYVGPIEIRPCPNPDHGRGLFTTKEVKAGDLLLCEKAFAAAFANPQGSDPNDEDAARLQAAALANPEGSNPNDEDAAGLRAAAFANPEGSGPNDEELARLRAELATKTFVKLHRNPSLQKEFMDLYPGPDAVEDVDGKTGVAEVDDAAVHNRIKYNAFAFPLLSHATHVLTASDPYAPSLLNSTSSRGIWLRASYINHSCYPLVRRSFIGDMMIFRAQADIPANTELKFGYISGMEPLEERQKILKKYGFECRCQICEAEEATSHKKLKRRDAITKDIIMLFEKEEPVSLHVYLDKLNELDKTYKHPPKVEPRKAMITPTMNLLPEILRAERYNDAIDLVLNLLMWLGFEFIMSATGLVVTRWGFMTDDIVMALADLCDAYRIAKPSFTANAERVAKKAYLIMCGEDESWEEEYGKSGKHQSEE